MSADGLQSATRHPMGAHLMTAVLIPFALLLLCIYAGAFWVLPLTLTLPWVPSLGIEMTLYIDGLALQFLLMITGIGTAVMVYAASYMQGRDDLPRMLVLLLAFMAAMIAAVVVDDLVALVVCWELTSITSFLLVGFKHSDAHARRSAQQALMTTVFGGLALMVGVVLLGEIGGTSSIRELIERAAVLTDDPRLPVALGCVFLGAFTKSAQWPFHFWLPNAMAAPTPISAYLHSATMVKLGVYLLARLRPAFGDLLFWELTLVSVGALTAVWAMILTLRERDLKRILAWSTVAALGTLVLLIGLPGPGAAQATSAFLLAHALYKAPLFFVAGNIDHCTGTRRIDHLAGMARVMPWTALLAALAAGSMAGVPMSFGYVAKDLISIAKTEGLAIEWVSYATLAVSALTVAVAAVAALRVFWHSGGAALPRTLHEASAPMVVAPLVVAAVGIVLGVAPQLSAPLVAAAGRSMHATTAPVLMGSVSPDATAAMTTVLVFLTGGAVYVIWEPLHRILASATWLDRYAFAKGYDRLLGAIPAVARFATVRLQHGSLPGYVAVTCVAFVLLVLTSFLVAAPQRLPLPPVSLPTLPVAVASLFILVAAIASCLVRDPFVMVLIGGFAGIGTATLALFLGAPDVAYTQFAVEVAFIVLVAGVIQRLRRFDHAAIAGQHHWRRATIAVLVGTTVSLVSLTAAAGTHDGAMARYFGERSLADAFGRNVVNVILVDFRALDTLGEIVVVLLMLVAIGPLIRALRAGRGVAGEGP